MIKRMISLFVFGIILLSFTCSGVQASTVKIGYIEFPPVFSTQNGKPEGYLIDLADMVLTRAGYQWTAQSFPTKRMVQELVDGGIHLWIGLSTLPQFRDKTLIGSSKVAEISLRAYTVGKKPPIVKKEDLSGKSVLIIRGYSYGGWINYIKEPANKVQYIETDDHVSGFRMLEGGRADYFLNYRSPAENALKKVTIQNLAFNDVSSFGAYFVVSKKAPKAEEFLKNMETAYKELVKEGKWTPPE